MDNFSRLGMKPLSHYSSYACNSLSWFFECTAAAVRRGYGWVPAKKKDLFFSKEERLVFHIISLLTTTWKILLVCMDYTIINAPKLTPLTMSSWSASNEQDVDVDIVIINSLIVKICQLKFIWCDSMMLFDAFWLINCVSPPQPQ